MHGKSGLQIIALTGRTDLYFKDTMKADFYYHYTLF